MAVEREYRPVRFDRVLETRLPRNRKIGSGSPTMVSLIGE